MWSRNALSERLNLEWPIFQAPMGELTTPSLAAAVSDAGALGGLGMWGFSADDVRRRIAGFRQQSAGGLNVNYPLWDDPGDLSGVGLPMREKLQSLYDAKGLGEVPAARGSAGAVTDDHLAVLIDAKPEVVSFHFGLPPSKVVAELKSAGVFIVCSATTADEARKLEAGGVDAVIAQGTEAGGHRGTFTGVPISKQPGLFSLLPQVVDAVSVPVIAAGGVADGRAIAAAIMLGASGVQVGTAFLRCGEANVASAHRCALGTAGDASTTVTDVVSGRPARFITNRLTDELRGTTPLPFPAQYSLTGPLEDTGDEDVAGLFAGQSVALTREMPAAKLIQTLAEETTARLKSV